MNHPFQSRISYSGDLEKLLIQVCSSYQLGEYKTHQVIGIGYEDFNVHFTTSKGEYLAKMFATWRKPSECERYVEIMEAALAAGIKHPKLHQSDQGFLTEITLDDVSVKMVVTDFITGKTFFQLKAKPDQQERSFLIEQATKINQLALQPEPIYDSWAVINFVKEYESIKSDLETDDTELINPVCEAFKQTDISALPKCFVHGDIIDTNVIKSESGELYILDFSVSNTYPRIQELAVLLCDLFFDYQQRDSFLKVYEQTLDEYQKAIPLDKVELETLPLYIQAAHAMHIIGASKANIEDGYSKENEHWITAGRDGLRFTLGLWK